MQHFDTVYADELIARLRSIPADAVPSWGTLRRDTLIEHLIWTMRHSMGRSQQLAYFGNWFTRRVVGPLYLRGLLPLPKNLRLPEKIRARGATLREPGDLETLQALVEEYLALVQTGELQPAPHPIFGDIGVDGWERVHVRHFDHHLRQFGV